MKTMRYEYKRKALGKIWGFYRNVAKKYKHTYDFSDMERNIREAVLNGYSIEKRLFRLKPTLSRWQEQGYHMAHSGKWYYAYTIDDDTITIQDACHAQNMHEETSI